MQTPRIYVDFQNADERGRLRLNCAGTTHDLARQGVRLYEGLAVTLYSDDADEAGRPAELRAAQYVRAFCDSSYGVEPPWEPWEVQLHGP